MAQAEAEKLNYQALKKTKRFMVSDKVKTQLGKEHKQKIMALNKNCETAKKNVENEQRLRIRESV